jgi:hypothetical protein
MIKKGITLIILLLLAGCGPKTQVSPITDIDVHKGVEGLKMQFLKNSPPDEVKDNSVVMLGFLLQNKGAYDINGGILSLGVEDEYMALDEWKPSDVIIKNINDKQAMFSLEGRSRLNTEGDKGVVTIKAWTYELEEQAETHTSTIMLTACYRYMTKLAEEVCIDTDLFGLRRVEKVCEVKDKSFSSQGAPVAITKVETTIRADESSDDYVIPEFKIYIRNKGSGEVIDSYKIQEACSSEPLLREDINKLYVSATLSGKPLKCEPDRINLREESSFVRCWDNRGISVEMGNYLAPLVVELDYGYTTTISKDVEIRKVT